MAERSVPSEGVVATLEGLMEYYRHKENLEHQILLAAATGLGIVATWTMKHAVFLAQHRGAAGLVVVEIVVYVVLFARWLVRIQAAQAEAATQIEVLRHEMVTEYDAEIADRYFAVRERRGPYWSAPLYLWLLVLLSLPLVAVAIGAILR